MVAIFCSLAQENTHPEWGYRKHLSCLDLTSGQNHAWFWWKSLNGNPNMVIVGAKFNIILPHSPKNRKNGVKNTFPPPTQTRSDGFEVGSTTSSCFVFWSCLVIWLVFLTIISLMNRRDERATFVTQPPPAFYCLLRYPRFSAGSGLCWEWNNALGCPSLLLLTAYDTSYRVAHLPEKLKNRPLPNSDHPCTVRLGKANYIFRKQKRIEKLNRQFEASQLVCHMKVSSESR
jgi:hypothetical protein